MAVFLATWTYVNIAVARGIKHHLQFSSVGDDKARKTLEAAECWEQSPHAVTVLAADHCSASILRHCLVNGIPDGPASTMESTRNGVHCLPAALDIC